MPAFCLILGAGFLAHPDYRVNPDAAAVAGAAVAVQAETGREALAIVVEGPGADALRNVARRAGGEEAAAALSAGTCPDTSDRIALIDSALGQHAKDIVLWTPEMLNAGAGPAPEAGRLLRELTGLPVPRPVAPQHHLVSVWKLPRSVDELDLLAAAFRSPWTSWMTLEGQTYLASDEPDLPAEMARTGPVQPLAENVELGRLRLVGTELPTGAKVLDGGPDARLALCPVDCAEGEPWTGRRFSGGRPKE